MLIYMHVVYTRFYAIRLCLNVLSRLTYCQSIDDVM